MIQTPFQKETYGIPEMQDACAEVENSAEHVISLLKSSAEENTKKIESVKKAQDKLSEAVFWLGMTLEEINKS